MICQSVLTEVPGVGEEGVVYSGTELVQAPMIAALSGEGLFCRRLEYFH